MSQAGFKIINIVLTESSFRRDDNFPVNEEIPGTIAVNTGYHVTPDNKLFCVVEMDYHAIVNDKKIVESKIKMAGIFEIVGTPDLDKDKFGKINAPSIVFPFIREHLASLTLKAGIPAVLLPPMNFVAMANNIK